MVRTVMRSRSSSSEPVDAANVVKSCSPTKNARRLGHRIEIQVLRAVMHVFPHEWRNDRAAKNSVAVRFGQRVPARMKIGTDFLRRN